MQRNFKQSQPQLTRFSRFRQSFREGAHSVGTALREDVQKGLRRVQKVPRWLQLFKKVYHDYGLKHVCLILVLVLYQFLGAGVFYMCEAGVDESKELTWIADIAENRSIFIKNLIPLMFNNTEYLFFLNAEQSEHVYYRLNIEMARYEKQLDIKYTDQKIRWDFWNAMLYAQTICTTIGYGHLYPSTTFGRIFTMIYAIFGIPLVLSILDDLGKLLTRCLKTPWWLIKCGCRRAFRYCTKQTMAEIKKLDEEDKRDLEIFDLPIPVAILVVIVWIFICSATFCMWEDWNYFVAFYFFFISLSTIGLGDITPTQPKYLLMLFIYIIIGLSLVSMCINLIQAQLERTYEAGRDDKLVIFDRPGGLIVDNGREIQRRGSSLGVFRSSSSVHSLNRETVQAAFAAKKKINKTCQTVLSFPSPTNTNTSISKAVAHSRLRFLPRTLSIDDVMRMVDTEDGDILVLTDLVREESGISQTSHVTSSSSDESSSQIVISKSFDSNFTPSTRIDIPISSQPGTLTRLSPSRPSVDNINEIEELEELEDRMALSRAAALANSVHFRSRLSLIPEQLPSTVEEGDEPSEDVDPLSPDGMSPPTARKPEKRSFHSLLGNLMGRRKSEKDTTLPTTIS